MGTKAEARRSSKIIIIIQVREMVAWSWMLTAEAGRSHQIHNSTIHVTAGPERIDEVIGCRA